MEIDFKIATPKPQLSVLLCLILQQEGFGKNLFLLLPKNALEVAACLAERPPSDYLRKRAVCNKACVCRQEFVGASLLKGFWGGRVDEFFLSLLPKVNQETASCAVASFTHSFIHSTKS